MHLVSNYYILLFAYRDHPRWIPFAFSVCGALTFCLTCMSEYNSWNEALGSCC